MILTVESHQRRITEGILFLSAALFAGWALVQGETKLWVYLFGGLAITITVFRVDESILPVILLLTLALGSSFRQDISDSSFYVRFLVLGLVAVRGLMLFLRSNANRQPQQQTGSTLLHWLFFLAGVIGTVSSPISIDPVTSLQRAISFLMLFFIIYIYFWFRCDAPAVCERYAISVRKGFAIILAVGCVLLISRVPGMYVGGRLRLVMGNPNQLGHYCAFMAPLLVWYLFEKARKQGRVLAIILAIVSLLALVLSGSRGGLLAAAVGLLVQFTLCYRKRLGFLLAGILFFGSIHLLFIKDTENDYQANESFFQDTVIRKETLESGSGRKEVWKASHRLIEKRPYFGYGFGVVDRLFQKGYFPIIREFQGGHVHNSYLEELLNMGWLGAFPLFGSLLYVLIIGVAHVINPGLSTANYRFTVALFSVFLVGLVSSSVESWFTSVGSVFCFPFWLACALFLKMARQYNDWRPAIAS
ncbi:MAG TPA: O-antigen ligase family protein [Bdellovibrionota bacterium]|nr:O-antigen ligase family protein [Bdellovibrionota bacterium]